MSGHSFDSDYRVTAAQKERFRRDGFVKLPGFLNSSVIEVLLSRVDSELDRGMGVSFNRGTTPEGRMDPAFNRAKYDFSSDKAVIFELLERPYFRQALGSLTGRDLFLTFELSFEMQKNISKGFPWHVGVQSFGFQPADEFGCTMWAPLHPIDPNGQRGGMAYVSEHVLPGGFVYSADVAVVEAVRARERAGRRTSVDDYFGLRMGILNSPVMDELLKVHQVEDEFVPGDVLLFNKTVVHRSVALGEGELPARAAYVLRFVDADSHYDLERAQCLEFPAEQYGKGFFPFKPVTRQHIEIAEAGAKHGDLLRQCAYFSDRDRRLVSAGAD